MTSKEVRIQQLKECGIGRYELPVGLAALAVSGAAFTESVIFETQGVESTGLIALAVGFILVGRRAMYEAAASRP